jgi:hypothetical protein
MDQLITFDEAVGFLKKSPNVSTTPGLHKNPSTLSSQTHKHSANAARVPAEPDPRMGWTRNGAKYVRIAWPFAIPINPGNTPIYAQFTTPLHMKMADAIFLQNKNYYLPYKNINRTCFKMLDENEQPQYKVSNVTAMTGWDATMSVRSILEQLEGSYGKPNMMTIHQTTYSSKAHFFPSKAPEMLFYCIEQCQEIQTIMEDPYTPKQIISNAIRLLMVLIIFPLKEFNT